MNWRPTTQHQPPVRFTLADRQWLITESTLDTRGSFLVTYQKLEPGAVGLPQHCHPSTETSYQILAGQLSLWQAGHWQMLPIWQTVTVPAGVAHSLKNEQTEPVEFRVIHTPVLGYECFLSQLHGLMRSGRLTLPPKGVSNWLRLSMLVVLYEREIQLVRPSHLLTRWLAFIGSVLGYRLPDE